jgi:hypothetical protein
MRHGRHLRIAVAPLFLASTWLMVPGVALAATGPVPTLPGASSVPSVSSLPSQPLPSTRNLGLDGILGGATGRTGVSPGPVTGPTGPVEVAPTTTAAAAGAKVAGARSARPVFIRPATIRYRRAATRHRRARAARQARAAARSARRGGPAAARPADPGAAPKPLAGLSPAAAPPLTSSPRAGTHETGLALQLLAFVSLLGLASMVALTVAQERHARQRLS